MSRVCQVWLNQLTSQTGDQRQRSNLIGHRYSDHWADPVFDHGMDTYYHGISTTFTMEHSVIESLKFQREKERENRWHTPACIYLIWFILGDTFFPFLAIGSEKGKTHNQTDKQWHGHIPHLVIWTAEERQEKIKHTEKKRHTHTIEPHLVANVYH